VPQPADAVAADGPEAGGTTDLHRVAPPADHKEPAAEAARPRRRRWLAAASFALPSNSSALGFSFNTFVPPAPQVNLAAPDAGSSPTLVFDGTVGEPNPGSLKASVTFTDYRQYVDAIVGPRPSLSLVGKTIHARVMLVSGTFKRRRLLHRSSTANLRLRRQQLTTLTQGTWTELTLNLANVTDASWDSTDIRQVGIQFPDRGPARGGDLRRARRLRLPDRHQSPTRRSITSASVPVAYNFDTGRRASGTTPSPPRCRNVNLAVTEAGAPGHTRVGRRRRKSLARSLKATVNSRLPTIRGCGHRTLPPAQPDGQDPARQDRLTSAAPTARVWSCMPSNHAQFRLRRRGLHVADHRTWTDLTLDLGAVTPPTGMPAIGGPDRHCRFTSGGVQEAGAYPGPNRRHPHRQHHGLNA